MTQGLRVPGPLLGSSGSGTTRLLLGGGRGGRHCRRGRKPAVVGGENCPRESGVCCPHGGKDPAGPPAIGIPGGAPTRAQRAGSSSLWARAPGTPWGADRREQRAHGGRGGGRAPGRALPRPRGPRGPGPTEPAGRPRSSARRTPPPPGTGFVTVPLDVNAQSPASPTSGARAPHGLQTLNAILFVRRGNRQGLRLAGTDSPRGNTDASPVPLGPVAGTRTRTRSGHRLSSPLPRWCPPQESAPHLLQPGQPHWQTKKLGPSPTWGPTAGVSAQPPASLPPTAPAPGSLCGAPESFILPQTAFCKISRIGFCGQRPTHAHNAHVSLLEPPSDAGRLRGGGRSGRKDLSPPESAGREAETTKAADTLSAPFKGQAGRGGAAAAWARTQRAGCR